MFSVTGHHRYFCECANCSRKCDHWNKMPNGLWYSDMLSKENISSSRNWDSNFRVTKKFLAFVCYIYWRLKVLFQLIHKKKERKKERKKCKEQSSNLYLTFRWVVWLIIRFQMLFEFKTFRNLNFRKLNIFLLEFINNNNVNRNCNIWGI